MDQLINFTLNIDLNQLINTGLNAAITGAVLLTVTKRFGPWLDKRNKKREDTDDDDIR
jgi:hypothetical protein